jgi:hypothetical protein
MSSRDEVSRRTSATRDASIKALLFIGFALAFLSSRSALLESSRIALHTFSTGRAVDDPGINILISIFTYLIHLLHPAYSITVSDVFVIQTALILLFSLMMIIPGVPWPVSLGGELCLIIAWLIFNDVSQSGHAVESWTIIICAAALAHLVFWRGSLRDYAVTALFGLILGYMPFMRRSAILIVVLPFALLLVFGALMWVVHFWRSRQEKAAFARVLGPASMILVLAIGVHWGGLELWAITTKTPFKSHGIGYPLYLSLGFANNPYNIVWDDDCAMATGILEEGVPWHDNPDHQRKLYQLWFQRIREDPTLIINGMVAKGSYLLRYFGGLIDPRAVQNDQAPVQPSSLLAALTGLFLTTFLITAKAFTRYRHDRMVLLFAGGVGLLVSGILPLLIIVPFYFGSCIATFLSWALILTPAARSIGMESNGLSHPPEFARNTWVYRIAFCIGFTAILGFAAFALFKSVVNRIEANKLLSGDPVQKFAELGYRYSVLFNRLPIEDQQTVVDRLLSKEHRQAVFRSESPVNRTDVIFQPVAAVAGDRMLAVIARMSRDWKMDLPSVLQGPRNSALFVSKETEVVPSAFSYGTSLSRVQKIADSNWDGRYRMFWLPQQSGGDSTTRFLTVNAFNFSGGSHMEGLVLDLISGDRLVKAAN